MSKAWTVFKYELRNTLLRRSFLLTLILVPLVPAIVIGVLGLLNQDQQQAVTELLTPDVNTLPNGFVDHAGLIQSFPEGFENGQLLRYSNEIDARSDLQNDKLGAVFIVSSDYLNTGKVTIVTFDANPVTGFEQTDMMESLLQYNLLGADADLVQLINQPVSYAFTNIAPLLEEPEISGPMAFYLPYGITMLFYVLILTSASFLLNNISKEKENRVMEVLLSSIKPIELFTGKILALGAAGLLQLVVWLGSAILIMRLGGTTLNLPADLQFSPTLLIWGVIFFILGYGLYGSLMAGVGAMVPNLRESSQATFIVIIPMIIPLMFISALIEDPNGSIATILSFIPFTSSTAMMTRLAATKVPFWQPALSCIILLITAMLVVRGVSKLFKAQTMLTGQKFSANAFLKALFSKAQ